MRKLRVFTLVFFLFSFFFSISACVNEPDKTVPNMKVSPKREVFGYVTKIYEISRRIDVSINSDFANIKLHVWNNPQIKFEITKSIKTNNPHLKLQKLLDSFSTETERSNNMFLLKSKYRGKYKKDIEIICQADIYLPHKLGKIDCILENGHIEILDDIKCSLNIKSKNANVKIAKLNGIINVNSNKGNLEINAGFLESGSKVLLEKGNIVLNAGLSKDGQYSFLSGNGIIRLKLPVGNCDILDQFGNSCMNIRREGTPVKINIG